MSRELVPLNERHIVAIGGGVTSPAFMRYMLGLTGKPNPRILYVNTPQGDAQVGSLWFHKKLSGLTCQASELLFFDRTPRDLPGLAWSQDAIFVGGGNTKSALAVWREYGFDEVLRDAWARGVVLGGSSAGGICWFQHCVTDSYADVFTSLNCLGILAGSCCPHYDGEVGRRETYHRMISTKEVFPGYALDESAGIHFVGDRCNRVLSANPGATCYRVEFRDGHIVETPLETTYLT